MTRTGTLLAIIAVCFVASTVVSAQPAGLLEQAIEENNAKAKPKGQDAKKLVEDADRFVERSFKDIRADIVAARRALQIRDRAAAAKRLENAERLLESLPKYVDVSVYRNQIRGLARSVRRAPRSPARANAGGPAKDNLGVLTLTEQDNGQDQAPVPPTESGEIVDVSALLDDDHQQHVYDREINAALRQNRANWILSANEAAIAPFTESLTYPADWPQRVAKRARYRDGVVYEGKPFVGDDGQTYFTAIYDLGDLVHPIPNFYATYPGSHLEHYFQVTDRTALQQRSQIFNGYPEDLAAGLPLLHFFGGIDHNAISTRTDPAQTARVTRIIESFIGGAPAPVGGG